jgi:predicted phage terminase large subunit-like protein
VIYTRQRKGTAIILTHTRWAMRDLAGQLLIKMAMGADQWEIVFLPAQALPLDKYPQTVEEQRKLLFKGVYIPVGGDQLGRQPGEALWPSQFPNKTLESIKANVENSEWLSLYQQIPGEVEDGFFLEEDFIVEDRDKVPAGLQWYRYIDLALGKTAMSDYNACIAIAHDAATGDIWGRDMVRVHELTQFLREIKTWMLSPEERGTIWGVEDVAFQILVFQQFMQDPDLVGVPITSVKPVGDKMTRALPVKTRARQKHFKLVNGPWIRHYIDEMTSLGGSGHDDQCDTTSGGFTMASVPKTTRLTFAVAKSQPEGVSYGTAG